MHVLVSGAGVAGPTLAWFLAKTGARITIAEKRSSLLPHGQNVDIKGSALTVIRKMGLMDDLRRLNTTEKGTQFIDPKGEPFARFPVQRGYLNSFTSEFEILRGDLAILLYEATKDHANIAYLFDTTVRSVISNDEGNVKVELSNGEVHKYDLLVAADGQWSKVRKQCFPPEDVKVVDLGMYAVYYTVPRLPADDAWWTVNIGLRSRLISIRPDPHGSIRAMFTHMPRDDAQKREWVEASRSGSSAQQELLRKEFADAGWQAPRLLEAVDQAPDFYFHVIQQIKMAKWSRSRVICLGDTAYAPSPLTGMGTSLAITGAYLLAGELSKLGKDEHPAKGLEAYENVFRPYVEENQKIPSLVPGIMHPGAAWQRWLLHTAIGGLSRAATWRWLATRFSDVEGLEDSFPWPEYKAFNGENAE